MAAAMMLAHTTAMAGLTRNAVLLLMRSISAPFAVNDI